jgi:hypothetical protein
MAFDKIYSVAGGEFKDMTFTHVHEHTYVDYTPFYTYEEAYAVWKEKMWLNVDNALYRLFIDELDLRKSHTPWRNSTKTE